MRVQLANPFAAIPFSILHNTGDYAGDAGAVPKLNLSKNGGALVPAYGTIVNAGGGLFWLMGDARDRDTLGPVRMVVTAPSGDVPIPEGYSVVNYDPWQIQSSQGPASNVTDTNVAAKLDLTNQLLQRLVTAERA
jgi:hypothetical protein